MSKISLSLFTAFFAILAFEKPVPPGNRVITSTIDEAFLMPVEDIFSISGRGTVATGVIERGKIKTGDTVEIVGLSATVLKVKVKSIEMFLKSVTEAGKGDNVGLELSDVEKSQLKRGMVICRPRSVMAYSEFRCQIKLLKKKEGGRTTPITDKYQPFFHFWNVDISGVVTLPPGKTELQPGDSTIVSVTLTEKVAIVNNMAITIKEGGRMVGTGKVFLLIKR